jgi:putative transcriptional regulator
MPRKRYRSDVFRSIHSIAEDLHAIGAIDKARMRGFDRACLTEIESLEPDLA